MICLLGLCVTVDKDSNKQIGNKVNNIIVDLKIVWNSDWKYSIFITIKRFIKLKEYVFTEGTNFVYKWGKPLFLLSRELNILKSWGPVQFGSIQNIISFNKTRLTKKSL